MVKRYSLHFYLFKLFINIIIKYYEIELNSKIKLLSSLFADLESLFNS